MQNFVESGYVTDLILAVMLCEMVLVMYLLRSRGAGTLAGFLGNLAAGASLVIALRLALQDAGWLEILAFLVVALAGHIFDLMWRLDVW
jgi:hypothetical protein